MGWRGGRDYGFEKKLEVYKKEYPGKEISPEEEQRLKEFYYAGFSKGFESGRDYDPLWDAD